MAGMVILNVFLAVGLICFFTLPISLSSLSENGLQFKITVDPSLQAVEFGEFVKVNCSTTCESTQLDIDFELKTRSGDVTNSISWKAFSYSSVQSWDLSIICLVFCGSGNNHSSLVLPVYNRDLNITPPPALVENKQYSLECIGPRVYPKDRLILRWLKGNKTLQTESTSDPGLPDEDNRLRNVLNINASKSHNGQNYTCVAEIDLGPNDTLKIQTSSITLQVNYKPRNTTISSDKSRPTSQAPIQISSGDNITLTCQSEASPSANYSWEYPNVTTDVKELSSGVLFVSNANSEHSGIYKCTARNHLGTDVQKVEIKVKVTDTTSLVAGFVMGVITLGVVVGAVAYYWYHKARSKGEYNLQNAKPNNNPQIPNALQDNMPLKDPKA